MNDTEIEETIRKYLLFKKGLNKDDDKDIKDIRMDLMKICENFHFFKKKIINNKNIKERNIIPNILNHLEFIYLKENEIIWDIGDKIDEIYIIFLGEVNIYKQKNTDIEESQLECTLGKGYSLGEDFIRNDLTNRTYKAETKTFCILGKIISKEYIRIFNKFIYEENILINQFYKELKLFTSEFIEKFQSFSFINYYDKDDYIFKQNDPFNTFYFIYSGNVRLMVNLNKAFKSKINNDIIMGKNNKKHFTSSRLFEIRGIYNELINYNIIDLTIGDIIGGIEYINKFKNYKYDVKCLTDVEVIKIDLNHFNKIVKNYEMKIFIKRIKNQTELISERLKYLKEGKEKNKPKDYILSRNKFTKTFLSNNPLTKNFDYKSELYINCSSNPMKIIKFKYSKKTLNNIKFSPNIVEEFNKSKNYKIKKAKSQKNLVNVKEFLINIDNKKKVIPENIYPVHKTFETIPHNNNINNNKIFFINNESNKNMDLNNIKSNIISSKFRSCFKNKKKFILSFKSISNLNKKTSFDKNKNKKILFNSSNLREKPVLILDTKNKKFTKYNINYNSFRNFTDKKFKTINNDYN